MKNKKEIQYTQKVKEHIIQALPPEQLVAYITVYPIPISARNYDLILLMVTILPDVT